MAFAEYCIMGKNLQSSNLMKKLLVICQNYPSPENPFSQPFIHTRLREYSKFFDVKVISFATNINYELDGIKVFSENGSHDILRNSTFETLISHAPNIRNHQRFIVKNFFKFKKFVFIFHGYEVIDIQKRVFSQKTLFDFPYPFSPLAKIYHKIKLPITCLFLKTVNLFKKCNFIFVSQQLLKEAREDLGCSVFNDKVNTFIVHNPINPFFFESKFESSNDFDFVCIRPFDDPKYGVDIFIKLAENNPDFTFHLYGKGILPKEVTIPKNLSIFRTFFSAAEMTTMLSKYRAAILPTRWDSQGVMACEIAALGMPLITSKLAVVEEFLGKNENVILLENENFHQCNLSNLRFLTNKDTFNRFSFENTTMKEIQVVSDQANLV